MHALRVDTVVLGIRPLIEGPFKETLITSSHGSFPLNGFAMSGLYTYHRMDPDGLNRTAHA